MHGKRADGKVDTGDEEEAEHYAQQEPDEACDAGRAPQRIDQKQDNGGRHGKHGQAKDRFAERLCDVHPLRIDRLDQVDGKLAFEHLRGHVLIDVVVIERADDPADGNVGQQLAEVKTLDAGAVRVNGFPDKIVNRNVDKVSNNSRVITKAIGHGVYKAYAQEPAIDTGKCSH